LATHNPNSDPELNKYNKDRITQDAGCAGTVGTGQEANNGLNTGYTENSGKPTEWQENQSHHLMFDPAGPPGCEVKSRLLRQERSFRLLEKQAYFKPLLPGQGSGGGERVCCRAK
jgi:hypothetical protein